MNTSTITISRNDSVEYFLFRPASWKLWLAISLLSCLAIATWVYWGSTPQNTTLRSFKSPLFSLIVFFFVSAAAVLVEQSFLFFRWRKCLCGDQLSSAGDSLYKYAELRAKGAFGSADRSVSVSVLNSVRESLQQHLPFRWVYPQIAAILVLLLSVVLFANAPVEEFDSDLPMQGLSVVVFGIGLASILFFPALAMSLVSRKCVINWHDWAIKRADAELLEVSRGTQTPDETSPDQASDSSQATDDETDPFSTSSRGGPEVWAGSDSAWPNQGNETGFPEEPESFSEGKQSDHGFDEEYNDDDFPDHAPVDTERQGDRWP